MNDDVVRRLREAINVDEATVPSVEDQLARVLSVGAVAAKAGTTGTEYAAAYGVGAPPATDAPEAEQAVEAQEAEPSTRRAAPSSHNGSGGEGEGPSPPRRRQWEQP